MKTSENRRARITTVLALLAAIVAAGCSSSHSAPTADPGATRTTFDTSATFDSDAATFE